MKNRYLLRYLSIYLFFFFGISLPQSHQGRAEIRLTDHIKNHLSYLGSDSLKGRATGTDGERLTSEYIAEYLKETGLRPCGDGGGYFQNIPMYGCQPLPDSQLLLQVGNDTLNLRLFEDYLLFKSGAQTHIPNHVPILFVGYGIIAPEFDYNDYLSVDASGKIVVFLSGEPEFDDPEYFAGSNPTIYSYHESKERIAISQGAIGSILIPSPADNEGYYWKDQQKEFSFEDITLAYRVTGHLSLTLKPDYIPALFSNARYNFNDVLGQIHATQLKSFPLNAQLSFKGHFKEREFIGRNVMGIIEGRDPVLKDSYLIISAHYDHLGIGTAINQDSIYNGVIDNAIGVAALLEISRMLKEAEQAPRRSILAIFLTGEEKGLLGSKYYVDHPVVPLYKTVADINIDGIAIFDTFNDIVGIGAEFSSLSEILEAVARVNGLHFSPVPSQFMDFDAFSRSDQIAFAQGGIPSVLISEGLQYQNLSHEEGLLKWINWMEHIYHTPFDDLLQPINYTAVEQHVRFLYDFCSRVSRMEQQPQWNQGIIYRNIRLHSIAEQR